ncbi:MAG: type II toxin-antitoxin system RelE/ParE family toxin [Gemmatimonadota bacterium]|nr:type II toxin-antitoxin system RelE/ParE family toxin [Gemmatimonadota bacterium]
MAARFLTFVQTPVYAAAAKRLIDDDRQREIELSICANPKAGRLEAGVRKIRIAFEDRGKRGGIRVIYYHIERKGKVYLLYLFAKNEKGALTKAEKNAVRRLTRLLEAEP